MVNLSGAFGRFVWRRWELLTPVTVIAKANEESLLTKALVTRFSPHRTHDSAELISVAILVPPPTRCESPLLALLANRKHRNTAVPRMGL